MDYTFEHDTVTNIGIFRITGTFKSPEDGQKMQVLSLQKYAECGCRRLLFDLTRATIVSGTLEAFATANPREEMGAKLRRFKIAVVFTTLTDHEQFLENVAVNRGYNAKVFDACDAALEWIKQAE